MFESLGGFDRRYMPAYYEDTDLAFAVRSVGLRVVYEPRARVLHVEGASAGTDTTRGMKAFQVTNQGVFAEKWRTELQAHPAPGLDLDAASTWRTTPTVLIVDGETPHPDVDSGSVRLVNIMRLLREEGAHVVFWPIDRRYDGRATELLQSLGVETFYAPSAASLAGFLRERGLRIDTVMACRYHVAREVLPLVRKHAPSARLVFDTVDLHYVRESRQAELENDATLRRLAGHTRRLELDVVTRSDATLVVSTAEVGLLSNESPQAHLAVLSNVHEISGRGADYSSRAGLVFVGGFRHLPNVDAVRWFVTDIFPLIQEQIPEVRFHCIGAGVPPEIAELAETDGVEIHGHVADLDPFMDTVRVSVAPLRFGAGVKGKINMSLAHGQPVVATRLAVEGMHLTDDWDVLVADGPAEFAACVVRLYNDRVLWERLAENGLSNVEAHFSMEVARDVVRRELLGITPSKHV